LKTLQELEHAHAAADAWRIRGRPSLRSHTAWNGDEQSNREDSMESNHCRLVSWA